MSLFMDAPPDFDDVLAILRKVALAAGDMILRGSETMRQKQAAGLHGTVKEKLNCMLRGHYWGPLAHDEDLVLTA